MASELTPTQEVELKLIDAGADGYRRAMHLGLLLRRVEGGAADPVIVKEIAVCAEELAMKVANLRYLQAEVEGARINDAKRKTREAIVTILQEHHGTASGESLMDSLKGRGKALHYPSAMAELERQGRVTTMGEGPDGVIVLHETEGGKP